MGSLFSNSYSLLLGECRAVTDIFFLAHFADSNAFAVVCCWLYMFRAFDLDLLRVWSGSGNSIVLHVFFRDRGAMELLPQYLSLIFLSSVSEWSNLRFVS